MSGRFLFATSAAIVLALGLGMPAHAQQTGSLPPDAPIQVRVDNAHVMKVPPQTSTLVIGNPMIADATIQAGGIMVITGKSAGATNLVAIDKAGRTLLNSTVQVQSGAGGVVRLHTAAGRESYVCSPTCEPSVQVGDSKDHFDKAVKQIAERNKAAQGDTPQPPQQGNR